MRNTYKVKYKDYYTYTVGYTYFIVLCALQGLLVFLLHCNLTWSIKSDLKRETLNEK